MLKCTINGKEIEVPEGTKLIEAFKMAETDIAHYCWHPGLSVAGVCRLCMVEIEGIPRLQIACNTDVRDGMVANNNSEKVNEAVKWGLDFHLINHPLDCPICDQAGECGLQDQYMKFGQYEPEMAEKKVKKHKVVDLGPTVVLDSERCILCSRCVRFTEEVTKTNELGIFNRGDRAEIGTHDGAPLDNNYSVNTVDICPVGALTSKDFRFQQRVWYLDDKDTVCPGCSTGCNVKMYYNDKGYFRIKPVYNKEVNGYWMCDEGRSYYKHVNKDQRILKAIVKADGGQKYMAPGAAAKEAGAKLKSYDANQVALVLTAQYTSEEYEKAVSRFTKDIGSKNVFHWINNADKAEDFDGLLLRGDRNPNTAGLIKVLEKEGLTSTWGDLQAKIDNGEIKAVVVAGPEIQSSYDDIATKAQGFSKLETLVWLSSNPNSAFTDVDYLIPMKTFVEKDGTFVNHAGFEQKISKMRTVVSQALSLADAADLLSGNEIEIGGL